MEWGNPSSLVATEEKPINPTNTVDLSPASVVTMYLLPDVNLKLKPNLLSQLKPGSRVVSHAFDMGDWKPDKTERINGRTIYFWTIPTKGR